MAFVVTRPNGTWEARESRRTPDGPRSRSLATFRELTPEVMEKVTDRAAAPVDLEDLRLKAVRAGAPVAESQADRAAAILLREVSMNRRPRRALENLLADTLVGPEAPISHEVARMKLWSGASPTERGQALVELLDLGDALPAGRHAMESSFPRIDSRP